MAQIVPAVKSRSMSLGWTCALSGERLSDSNGGLEAMRPLQGKFQVTDKVVLIIRDSPIVNAPDALDVGDQINGYTLSTYF